MNIRKALNNETCHECGRIAKTVIQFKKIEISLCKHCIKSLKSTEIELLTN
jgi:hypothetical protein